MMWNFESCLVLLWALGKIKMGSPRSSCHQNKLFQAVRRLKESPLRVQPLRPVKEILDEWDCIYRRHWAVTQSMFDFFSKQLRQKQCQHGIRLISQFQFAQTFFME